MLVSFPLAFVVIRSIKETNYDDEQVCLSCVLGYIIHLMSSLDGFRRRSQGRSGRERVHRQDKHRTGDAKSGCQLKWARPPGFALLGPFLWRVPWVVVDSDFLSQVLGLTNC